MDAVSFPLGMAPRTFDLGTGRVVVAWVERAQDREWNCGGEGRAASRLREPFAPPQTMRKHCALTPTVDPFGASWGACEDTATGSVQLSEAAPVPLLVA